ncbi:MAG: hypothetical protein DMG57_32355 [Acidobacteria bacterium]|nr:MAG: hypothetical protein DMG57_32355 [Acidobacteriota bacterium]
MKDLERATVSAFSVAEELCRRVKPGAKETIANDGLDRLYCWRKTKSAVSTVTRRPQLASGALAD